MTSANFVLLVNFSLAALFATAFVLIANYDQSFRSARWFAASYLLGLVLVTTELLLPMQVYTKLLYMIGFSSFLLALLCASVAITRRYAAPAPVMLMVFLFVSAVALNFFAYEQPRNSLFRQFSYQMPMALALWLMAAMMGRYGRKTFLDITLVVVMILNGLTYVARPVLASMVGGTGDSPSAYITTQYAAYSQLIGAICATAGGLLFILAYIQDILYFRRVAPDLDPATGVHTRASFLAKGRHSVARLAAEDRVGALLMVDIDWLDQINTTLGYDRGDEVIRQFAEVVREQASIDHRIGRIGGDRFAVWMPKANAESAMEFAESLRSAFWEAEIGMQGPGTERCTASLGVCVLPADMSFDTAVVRADGALSVAKHEGRNRVHLDDGRSLTGAGRRRQFRTVQ